jgi:predicted cupin superfamily sugar epimerase
LIFSFNPSITQNMSRHRLEELISHLNLEPHPEGGFFRETHRSLERVARASGGAGRSAATAIYYLLAGGDRSTWHLIDSEEMWHFYEGDPLHVHVLLPQGELQTLCLGNALEHEGAHFQALVPAGAWFAAECTAQEGYSLVGCTVAPGFEFDAFEIARADQLLGDWPQHGELIERLARK